MTDTATLAAHVREILLTAGFNGTDGGILLVRFRITEGTGVTVGCEIAGDVPESMRPVMLRRYAAALREAGMAVADRSERGHIYVHDGNDGHRIEAARSAARICRTGYASHVREHGPDGAEVGAVTETADGGTFTVVISGIRVTGTFTAAEDPS